MELLPIYESRKTIKYDSIDLIELWINAFRNVVFLPFFPFNNISLILNINFHRNLSSISLLIVTIIIIIIIRSATFANFLNFTTTFVKNTGRIDPYSVGTNVRTKDTSQSEGRRDVVTPGNLEGCRG